MRVVGRNDQHRIDVFLPLQHFAEIFVDGAILIAVFVVDDVPGFFAIVAVHIADGNYLRVGLAQKGLHIACALVANADTGYIEFFARRGFPLSRRNVLRDNGQRRRRSYAAHKTTPRDASILIFSTLLVSFHSYSPIRPIKLTEPPAA